jgi:hypothetical protein
MEGADPSVSLDLVIRALLMAGGSKEVIAEAVASRSIPKYSHPEDRSVTRNSAVTGQESTTGITMATAERMVNTANGKGLTTSSWKLTA